MSIKICLSCKKDYLLDDPVEALESMFQSLFNALNDTELMKNPVDLSCKLRKSYNDYEDVSVSISIKKDDLCQN